MKNILSKISMLSIGMVVGITMTVIIGNAIAGSWSAQKGANDEVSLSDWNGMAGVLATWDPLSTIISKASDGININGAVKATKFCIKDSNPEKCLDSTGGANDGVIKYVSGPSFKMDQTGKDIAVGHISCDNGYVVIDCIRYNVTNSAYVVDNNSNNYLQRNIMMDISGNKCYQNYHVADADSTHDYKIIAVCLKGTQENK